MWVVQMRFPKALVHRDQRGEWLLDAHHFTLLDGEMLVDEDLSSGAQTRRFLAYDCMAWNTKPLGHKPWQVGFL
jgi:mRNA-capping enzyme